LSKTFSVEASSVPDCWIRPSPWLDIWGPMTMNDRSANRPFVDSPEWWGPRWIGAPGEHRDEDHAYLSILDLVDAGTLDPRVAAFLWELIARRSSMIVVAGPSGVGKTTLLTALTDFVSPGEHLIPVRGVFDPLTFLDDPGLDPRVTTVMVNEISPHLPIYLWGPGVSRLLTSPRRFRIFATAHATSAQDLVAQLAGYPLRVPMAGIARLDVVVRIDARREGGDILRAVTEVSALESSPRGGIVVRPFLDSPKRTLMDDAVQAWLDESPGRGAEQSLRTRHNILSSRDAIGESDRGLRSNLAAAFSGVTGDT
jgi:energy-coupling factor transporter ATP-binding protein EcfA2